MEDITPGCKSQVLSFFSSIAGMSGNSFRGEVLFLRHGSAPTIGQQLLPNPLLPRREMLTQQFNEQGHCQCVRCVPDLLREQPIMARIPERHLLDRLNSGLPFDACWRSHWPHI